MVFEAKYLVAVLTAGHMSLCCGQNRAQMSKVLRPSNKSNGRFICFFMAVEETGSECGLVHPPYAKPLRPQIFLSLFQVTKRNTS